MKRPGARGAATLVCALLVALACSSDEDRARSHTERGREYLAEEKLAEATLEFRSALRFDEDNVEANFQLGRIEVESGNLANAMLHFDRVYQADPSHAEAVLHLAALLQTGAPDRAEALIEGLIEAKPDAVEGYIARSNLELHRGRVPAAIVAARKAMSVAPEDPRADFQLGYSLQAMIREAQLTGEPLEDSVFQSALGAFERYIDEGGEAPWNAQVEQARILAAWKDHNRQASRQFHTALENASENGHARDIQIAAARAIAFATAVRDWELKELAYETLVKLEPRDYVAWGELAEARRRQRQDPEHTWKQLLEARPQDPRAHIEYARFLVSKWKLDEALAYLQEKANEGVDPTMLRSAVASTQLAAGRMEDAQETVRQLEKEFPDKPRTVLARAQLDIRRGRIRKATSALQELKKTHPDPEALLLLARTELARGDREAALSAIDAAIDAEPFFTAVSRRMRAQVQAAQGDHEAVLRTLEELEKRGVMEPDDILLAARARYELGRSVQARRDLLELVRSAARPPAQAILELSRRESENPATRAIAKRELEKLVRREPRNWDALWELVRLQSEDGENEVALARIDHAFGRNNNQVPPRILMLRAQTRANAGIEEGTLEDAQSAFAAQPRLRGALELLVGLHLRRGEVAEALAAAETARDAQALSPERRLLLARLYRMNGKDAEAVSTLETALETDAENPSVYFHLGMALRALDREPEATRALEKALAISSSFPEAEHARRALEDGRGEG